jgi:hypothetical protein
MQRLGAMVLAFAVSGALACELWAQTAITVPNRVQNPASGITAVYRFSTPGAPPPIVGAPYCGERVSEQRQQLADGTNVVRQMTPEFVCRDSQGRTRSERSSGPPGPPEQAVKIVEITDAAAGIRYVIDSYNHVVHASRFTPRPAMEAMPANMPRPRPPGTTVTAPGPPGFKPDPGSRSSTIEELGTKYIDNVMAEGRKTTTTFPAGTRGNDRPIVTTHETWSSPELRLTISSTSFDPASGETISKIVNLSRAEPDVVLFQLPFDCKVVEETGPYEFRIGPR